MIEEKDLKQAITECEAERNPNVHTCMKLAAFYYLFDRMQGPADNPVGPAPAYSFAAGPSQPAETPILYDSGTEFAEVIAGRDPEDIWPIMDELMGVLENLHPKLYNAVLRKIDEL